MYRHCKATVFSGQIRFCETSMAWVQQPSVSTRVCLLEVPQCFAIVLRLKCRRCSTVYFAQTLRTITGSICLTIGTSPFLKKFAGCRISDRPKGMLKLCHFICSALLTNFMTLSTARSLESGGVSALCLSLILHFFWHSLLHIGSLNMLVSLRGAASLWIKDVSTKMKTYTINHWYAWCWSCERWELMKLSYSSCKHHRQNIVPPVLAASHRQTYGDNMSSSESSDVSLTIHRSKLPTGDHPRMAMWVWNCRFSHTK